MDSGIKMICFDLKKSIDDRKTENQINKSIDELTSKNELTYVLDGHYKLSENCNSDDVINAVMSEIREDAFLNEYIDISVWTETK